MATSECERREYLKGHIHRWRRWNQVGDATSPFSSGYSRLTLIQPAHVYDLAYLSGEFFFGCPPPLLEQGAV